MHTENAHLSGRRADTDMQKCWNAFCESGSVYDYLRYRASCEAAEEIAYADPPDRQRTDPA